MPSYIESGARRRRRTPIVLTWLITLLAALIGFSAPGLAAVGYPLVPVTNAAGTPICDVVGDENPDQADVACDPAGASAYIGSDGTTVTAGLVLTEDPRTTGADAPLEGFTWQVAVGVNGTQVATMGISGKGTNDTDFLYVKCISATDPHYVVNATLAIANGTIQVSPAGAYSLLAFTVPVAALAPCGITASTPVQLFFGTSQANNLDVINKDFFTGTGVNFAVVPPITFGGTLAVTKTRAAVAGPNPPELGQTTTYDLVVTAKNPSVYPLANVNVTDTLPGDVAIQSVTPTAGNASVVGQDVTWSGFGLVAGESRTLTIRVTVTPAPGNVGSPMLLNPGAAGTATRVAGGGTVSDTSGPVSTASVLGPGLGVTKTVSPATVGPGDTVTYTVSLANAGTATTTVNTISDTLPAGFTYVATTGGTLGAAAPVVGAGNVVTWSGPFSILAGDTRTLIFTATASNSPGAFDNVVVADAATIGPVSTGNTATVTVVPKADLSITKTDAPDPVVAGDNLTYTIAVSNAGPSPATDVTVTDVLPAGVVFVPASSGTGCNLAAGTVTCAVGIVNVGTPATVTIVVTTLAAGALSNTATVGAATNDPNPANNAATATTNVQPTTANLSVTKTASPTTAVAGQTLTYTLGVTNAGPGTAPNVQVTDVLPASLTFDAGASSPACAYAAISRTVTCTAVTVAAGAGVSFSVVTVVDPGATGTITNTAAVGSAIPDGDPAGDSVTLVTPVATQADVSVTVADSPDPVTAGGSLVYGLTATNTGPSNATTVLVNDVLPLDVAFVSAPGCTYDVGSRTVSCAAGILAPGQSAPFVVTVQVSPAATGTITNTATATTTTTDVNPANNTATAVTTVAVLADLAITKVAGGPTAIPGGSITYTLGVTNLGPSAATLVQINDVLAPQLTLVSAPGCSYDGPTRTLTCAVGALGVGASAGRTVIVSIDPAATGTMANTATALSAAVDPNLANNAATAAVSLLPSADLVATLAATPDPVTAGQNLSVVAGVTNAGPSTATGVVVATTLPAALTPGALPVGCSFDGLTRVVSCTTATLAPVVGSASFTIPTTVNAATPAGITLPLATVVNSATPDPVPANNAAATNATVRSDNDLSVALTDSPDPVVAGGLLTYTATVTNTGPSTATGVSLTLSFPTGVTLAPASVPAGCTYDLASRLLTCSLGTLGTGPAAPVMVVVAVDPATTGPLGATATVTSTSPDPVAANNSDTATTAVITSANVALIKAASPSPAVPGAPLVYTLTATNAGPSTATGLIITDVLPAGLSAPQTPLPAGCGYNAGTRTVTCTIASLAPGASAGPSFVVTVDPATTSPVVNTATLALSVADPSPADNVATTATPVAPSADLAAAVSATPITATAGRALSIIAGVTNAGPSTATAVVVATTLPPGMVPGTLPAGCTFDETTRVVTCLVGTLAPGAAVNFTLPTTVSAASPPGVTLPVGAVVGSLTPDPTLANNSASTDVAVQAITDLAMAKTASPSPVTAGTPVSYTLTVTNNGPSVATAVVITDILPASLGAPQTPLPAGCVYDPASSTLTCTVATLAPGANASRTVVATVSPSFTGALVNTATVLPAPGTSIDPSLADNSSTATVTVVAPPLIPPPPPPPPPPPTTTTTTTTTTVPVAPAAPAVIETFVLPTVLTAPLRALTIASVTKPEPVPTPVVVTRAAPAAVATLARTGTRSITLASWGLSFIVGGALLTLAGRRRRCARPVSRESGSPTG